MKNEDNYARVFLSIGISVPYPGEETDDGKCEITTDCDFN